MKLFSYLTLFILIFACQTYGMRMLARTMRCAQLVGLRINNRNLSTSFLRSHLIAKQTRTTALQMRRYFGTKVQAKNIDIIDAIAGRNIKGLLTLYTTQPTVFQEKRDGLTPLQFAATRPDNLAVIEFLIAAGASVDAQTNTGDTALHLAAQCNNKKAIKLLLAHGADASIKNKSGKTALEQSNIPFDYLLES